MKKQWLAVFQVLLVLAAFAGSVYVAFTPANSLMRWYNIDDAFYYYKVAQNILTGNGISFDGINLSNGFHPLWMLICLIIFSTSKLGLIFPLRLLVIVSGLFNAASAWLLYKLLEKFVHSLAALITALTWAVLPAIYNISTVHGMESSISVFFIILLMNIVVRLNAAKNQKPLNFKSMFIAGLIGAFTILARLDNIFIVGILGLFLLFNITRISRLYLYDLIALFVSVLSVWFFRIGAEGVFANLAPLYFMLALSLVIKPVVYYFCGLYSGVNELSKIRKVIRQVIAVAVNSILIFGILLLAYRLGISKMISRSIMAYDAFLSFLLIFCLRLFRWKGEQTTHLNPVSSILIWLKQNWRSILINGLGYATPIGTIIGAYMIFNKIKFGSFTPVSGQIKTWWGNLSNTVYGHKNTMLSVFGLSDVSNYGPWSIVTAPIKKVADWITKSTANKPDKLDSFVFLLIFLVAIIILIAILTANEQRLLKKCYNLFIIPLLLGCMIQIGYYNMIGYAHTRGWYWLAEFVVLVLLGGLVLDGLFTWVQNQRGGFFLEKILFGVLAFGLLFTHLDFIYRLAPPFVSAEHSSDYISEIREVETRTEPGSKIGMTGGGMVAYFIQNRTVINLDGLINSVEYFHAMKNGVARDFLDRLPLNYVYGQEYVVTESDPYKDILDGRLVSIGVIKGFENFTLFKYVINQ